MTTIEHLKHLASQRKNFSTARITQEYVIQAFLRRLALSDLHKTWLLRGGILTQHWITPAPRPTDDLDFLSLDALDVGIDTWRLKDIAEIHLPDGVTFDMHHTSVGLIWEETDFPGLRAIIPVTIDDHAVDPLQIDIGYGDPVTPAPLQLEYPCHIGDPVFVMAVRPETLVGWKLHGLFEFDDQRWRAKDLLDLYRFFQYATLELDALPLSIATAFMSRDTSLERTDRLIFGEFGQSRGSKRQWRRFLNQKPEREPPTTLQHVVDTVSAALRPHVALAKDIEVAAGRDRALQTQP